MPSTHRNHDFEPGLSAHRVTLDTIAGALCAYCLIGLTWAFVYRAIFSINLRSFVFASGSFAQIFEQKNWAVARLMNFAYYSFATLTTTEFGDITPTSRGGGASARRIGSLRSCPSALRTAFSLLISISPRLEV
jgi:hypothetical protein